jgi:hypothetical protein
MNTAQSSMPALAAGFYPTQERATGVAWMLGMGSWTRPVWYCRASGGLPFGHAFAVTTPAHWIAQHGLG